MDSSDTGSLGRQSVCYNLYNCSKKFNVESLQSSLEEIKSLKEGINLENAMLQRFWSKVGVDYDPALLANQGQSNLRSIRPKSCFVTHSSRLVKLTAEQKCIVAQFEIDEFHKEQAVVEREYDKILDGYRAALEAASIVEAETIRNKHNFDKSVAFLHIQSRELHFPCAHGNKLHSAFVRFHKQHMRKMDTLENNLRMDNKRLSRAYKRVNRRLSRVYDKGSPPGPIEIKELRIRCDLASETINQKNLRCMQLKSRLVKVTQYLNNFRLKLDNELQGTDLFHREHERTSSLNQLLRKNVRKTELLRAQDIRANQRLQMLLTSYRVPETDAYIKKMTEFAELIQEHVKRERKLKIAEVNLMHHKKLWCKLKKS